MALTFSTATNADAAAIALLRNATAQRLADDYGLGPWSSQVTEKGVLYGMRTSRVLIARDGTDIVATLSLTTRKPWSILRSFLDRNAPTHFTVVKRPLYLIAMAVAPDKQRTGIGRRFLKEAIAIARAWPADLSADSSAVALAKAEASAKVGAIRLDAYDVDSDAGAGAFYAKCGFREIGRATYRKPSRTEPKRSGDAAVVCGKRATDLLVAQPPLIYFEMVL